MIRFGSCKVRRMNRTLLIFCNWTAVISPRITRNLSDTQTKLVENTRLCLFFFFFFVLLITSWWNNFSSCLKNYFSVNENSVHKSFSDPESRLHIFPKNFFFYLRPRPMLDQEGLNTVFPENEISSLPARLADALCILLT